MVDNKHFIANLIQKDNHTFTIMWNDGVGCDYRLSTLQKDCPCASCQGNGQTEEDVRAIKIRNVGRYALSIEFTSGCSAGIYSYEFLRAFIPMANQTQ